MTIFINLRKCSTFLITNLHRISSAKKFSNTYSLGLGLNQITEQVCKFSVRSLSIQKAERNYEYIQEKSGSEVICNKISNSLKRFGAIQKENIIELHNSILKSAKASPSSSLFLLQCCGNPASVESSETRNKLATDIWNSFSAMDFTPDISHYNVLLQVFLENGYNFSPLEFLANLQEKDIHPNRITFSRLIAKFCEDGDMEGANKILQFLKDEGLNVTESVFNSLIIGYSRANDLEGATGILDVMKESNLLPGPDTYAALLQAYAELDNSEEFSTLLSKIDNDQIFITEDALMEVIYSISLRGKGEQAKEILARVKKSSGHIPRSINIICRLLNAGFDEIAYEIFKTVPANSELPYNGQYFTRQLAVANYPLIKIVSYCHELVNNNINVNAFANALDGFLHTGNVERSLALMRVMKENNIPIREHFIYPLFCTLKGTPDIAYVYKCYELISELELKVDHDFIRIYLLPALNPSLSINDFSDVYMNLLKLSPNVDSHVIYNGIVDYLITFNQLGVAAKFVNEWRKGVWWLLANPLAEAYLRSYNVSDTVSILRQMLPFSIRTRKIENTKMNDATVNFDSISKFLKTVISNLKSKEDFIIKFQELLDGMLKEGVCFDDLTAQEIKKNIGNLITPTVENLISELTNPSLLPQNVRTSIQTKIFEIENKGEDAPLELKYSLINMHLLKKDIDKALPIINALKDDGVEIPNNILVILAKTHLEANNLVEAEKIFNNLKDDHPNYQLNATVVIKYATALVKEGRIQDAVQACLMHSPEDGVWSKDLAPEYKENFYRIRIANLLKIVVEKKDLTSLQLLQEALLTRKFASPSTILSSLITYYIQENNIEKGLETFESIFKEHHTTVGKYELSVECIKKSYHDELQRILNISNEVHGEMNTLFDLGIALIDCGKINEARKVFETSGFRMNQSRLDERCAWYVRYNQITELEGLMTASKNIFNVNRQRQYNYLLKALIALEDPHRAMGAWLTMQEEGTMPSEEFLFNLASFLKSKNMEVPFAIPERSNRLLVNVPQTKDINHRNVIRSSPKKNINDDNVTLAFDRGDFETACRIIKDKEEKGIAIEPETQSRYIVHLLSKDNLQEALKIAKKLWGQGDKLSENAAKILFSKLAEAGDFNTIEFAHKYLSPQLNRRVMARVKIAAAYVKMNKTEDYLNRVLQHVEAEEKDLDSLYLNIPPSIVREIVVKEPTLLPLVEKIADIAAKDGRKSMITNVMHAHLLTQNEEKANIIHDTYLHNETEFDIEKICVHGLHENNHSIFDSIMKVVDRCPDGRENLKGAIHSIKVDLLRKENKFSEAVSLVETCLQQNLTIRKQSLESLKKEMEKNNLTFPFTIEAKRKEESSSSSSSDDEKKPK